MDKLKNFFDGEGLYFTFTVIADILAVLAFATAVSGVSFRGTLILFAITYFGTFLEQRKSYIKEKKEINALLASAGCVISIILLALCTVFDMGVANIDIQKDYIPRIILSCGDNTYFQWRSINITYYVFVGLLYPLIIHILIVIVDFLKRENVGVVSMYMYLRSHVLYICMIVLGGCAIGCVFCGVKYNLVSSLGNKMGSPQYAKYATVGGILAFIHAIWHYSKKNYYMQKNVAMVKETSSEQLNSEEQGKETRTDKGINMNEILNKIQREVLNKPGDAIKLLLGCAGIGAFCTNAIWYLYQLGYFSQLKIDKCYISINGTISIYEAVTHLILGLTLICANVIVIYMNKMNRKRAVVLFLLSEGAFVFFYVSSMEHISLYDLLIDVVRNRNFHGALNLIKSLLKCVYILNIFSFSYWLTNLFEKILRGKKKKYSREYNRGQSDNENSDINQQSRTIIVVCVFVCILFLSGMFTYFLGRDAAYYKKDYRIIEDVQPESTNANSESKLYAIIFQTENEYIVAEIFAENDEPIICYDRQIIIPKNGIETIYYEDYREISIK